jgi:hypothetical protein
MSLPKDLASENEALRQRLKQLAKENIITVEKQVYPPGYLADMKELHNLRKDHKKLIRILEFGDISTLESLINTYQDLSKRHLSKIIKEYQFCVANKDDREKLQELIECKLLEIHELKELLLISDEGD